MKIALLTDTFERGGGLEHLVQVTRAMRDVSFAVFARGGTAAERLEQMPNVKVLADGYRPARVLRERPDVVHVHHLKPLLRFYANPLFSPPVPVVFTVHGVHLHRYEFHPGLGSGLRRFCRLRLERSLLRRVDAVVAVSREDETFLQRHHGLTRILRIPNGIDLRAFTGPNLPREKARRALLLPPNSRVFLTAARFDFQKGYDVLVRAIGTGRELFERHEVLFVFAGDGPETGSIRRLAERTGVQGLIRFLGERRDVYEIMQASDLFILPSRWEGLSMALIEASSCGLPIVASKTCGNREFVQDTGAGLLFENDNPEDLYRVLRGILESRLPERSRPAAAAAAERLGNYDIVRTCRELRALYASLAAGRSRRSC